MPLSALEREWSQYQASEALFTLQLSSSAEEWKQSLESMLSLAHFFKDNFFHQRLNAQQAATAGAKGKRAFEQVAKALSETHEPHGLLQSTKLEILEVIHRRVGGPFREVSMLSLLLHQRLTRPNVSSWRARTLCSKLMYKICRGG